MVQNRDTFTIEGFTEPGSYKLKVFTHNPMKYTVKNRDKFIYEDTAKTILDNYRNGIEHFMVGDSWVYIASVSKTNDEVVINIEADR